MTTTPERTGLGLPGSTRPSPSRPVMLERFTPAGSSLEWRISQAYWASRGSQAFLADEVPHLITNDGMHAARAADVLFVACDEAARADSLEDTIQVVELGVGLGLHARLFLDRFRARCADARRDFYDRLRFHATDCSRRILEDIDRRGLFTHHGDHVRLGLVDAIDPGRFVALESGEEIRLGGLRAVLHNYLLDSLPYDVLVRAGAQWLSLHLQTRIDAPDAARRLVDLDPARLAAIAAGHEGELAELLPLYELLLVERAYLPVDLGQVPFGEHVASFVEDAPHDGPDGDPCVVASHGALRSLIAARALLRRDGFVLFSDYGDTVSERSAGWARHQRYAGSRAMALDFALLQHVLGRLEPSPIDLVVPEGDERAPIHSRLLCAGPMPAVEAAFREAFIVSSFEHLRALMDQARAARGRGDLGAAGDLYVQACQYAPENWYTLIERAEFTVHGLRDAALGLELAEAAVEKNPVGSALVHDVLGDALQLLGRSGEAIQAYRFALDIQPDDMRAHASLSRVYLEEGYWREAITEIGAAIACDEQGTFRRSLLDQLVEILDRREARARQSHLRDP